MMGYRQMRSRPCTDVCTRSRLLDVRVQELDTALAAQPAGEPDEKSHVKRHVYVLESIGSPGRFYVGLTRDVEARVRKHNEGGCIATKSARPWTVRTVVSFDREDRAKAFERYLKSGSGRAFSRRHF